MTDQLFFGRGGLDLVRLEDHDWILYVVVTDSHNILANSVPCGYLNGIGAKPTQVTVSRGPGRAGPRGLNRDRDLISGIFSLKILAEEKQKISRALDITRRIQFHLVALHQNQTDSRLSALTPVTRALLDTIALPKPSTTHL